MTRTIEVTTRLAATPAIVWAHANSMRGVNREMAPWLRMTHPPEVADLDLTDPRARIGDPLFTSWILFLRVLPVERFEVTLAEIGPGMRFVEQSRVLTASLWRHERSVAAAGSGSQISDRVTFGLRAPPLERVMQPLLRAFFHHRHRKLVALFGAL